MIRNTVQGIEAFIQKVQVYTDCALEFSYINV